MLGQRVPDITFRTREDGKWKDVTTRYTARQSAEAILAVWERAAAPRG